MQRAAKAGPQIERRERGRDAGRLGLVEVRRDQLVLVRGARIEAILPGSAKLPTGARLVDLSRYTVLPGLIDCHTHLIGDAAAADVLLPLERSEAQEAFSGVRNARATLLAGFTTVRDVGTYRAFVDVALRDAINDGSVIGPRMKVAGAYVTVSNYPGTSVEVARGNATAVQEGNRALPHAAQIVFSDDKGEMKLETVDGKKLLTAKDPQGKLLFSGPVETKEDLDKLPPEVRQRYENLQEHDLPAVAPRVDVDEDDDSADANDNEEEIPQSSVEQVSARSFARTMSIFGR